MMSGFLPGYHLNLGASWHPRIGIPLTSPNYWFAIILYKYNNNLEDFGALHLWNPPSLDIFSFQQSLPWSSLHLVPEHGWHDESNEEADLATTRTRKRPRTQDQSQKESNHITYSNNKGIAFRVILQEAS